jgi:hypothetical protein
MHWVSSRPPKPAEFLRLTLCAPDEVAAALS